MTSPFTFIEPKKAGFLKKLLNTNLKENAIIEVNNLLARKPISTIQTTDILHISDKYKINLPLEFSDELLEFYQTYLKECIKDSILTLDEVDNLKHLKNLLALSDYEVEDLHNKVAGEIYKKNYNEVINDGLISEQERYFLSNVQKNVLLSQEIVNKISDGCRSSFLQSQFNEITSDQKVSPAEWNEFSQIAKNLNATLELNTNTQESLEKYRLYWFIENEKLPEQSVQINLQKNETCFFTIAADWLENRTVTQRVNYSGINTRIRIMKGLYYNMGSISPNRITSEELTVIDSGIVYITNKRVIFMGGRKNTNIKLDKILALTPYSDGVGIEKDAGKSPILRVPYNADILMRTLGRVINDY